jgi:hypothetical protein
MRDDRVIGRTIWMCQPAHVQLSGTVRICYTASAAPGAAELSEDPLAVLTSSATSVVGRS